MGLAERSCWSFFFYSSSDSLVDLGETFLPSKTYFTSFLMK